MTFRVGLGLGIIPPSARNVPTAAPVNVVLPSISGIETEGQTLTANPGSWSGLPSGAYAYQWERDGSPIGSATSSTYVLTGSDVDADITVDVTATNTIGSTTATSSAVTPAAALAISGTPGDASVGAGYTFTPSVVGGHTPYSFALTGTLPAGLSFNTTTGAITGTPVSSGTADDLNITVTDDDGLTDALGAFDLVVSADDVTFEAENEPTTITLDRGLAIAGDSVPAGVGTSTSPTDYSVVGQFAGMVTNPSLILDTALQGRGYTPTASPSDIPEQVAGAGATPLATYDFAHATGLNDYNTGVVTEAEERVWPVNVLAGQVTLDGHLTGDADQHNMYFSGFAEANSGPGMIRFADWEWLQDQVEATYGADPFNLRRWFISKTTTDATDLDRINVETWWDYALSFHGAPLTVLPAPVAQTAWLTFSDATNTAARAEAAFPSASNAQGALAQNLHANSINGDNIYINTESGWIAWDAKHPNRLGAYWWAVALRRRKAAIQGDGAPFANPFRLFLKKDAAAGTEAGTIYYLGATAPDTIGLFDENEDAVTTLVLTDNGVTNGRGTITVTRSAEGTLTEGEMRLKVQTKKGTWVLHTEGDFRIGQASTQTTPRNCLIPYSNDATETVLSDFSVGFRGDHGASDGDSFHIVAAVTPSVLGATRCILSATKRSGQSTDLFIRIGSSGQLAIVGHDADNVLVFNGNVATNVFAAGVETVLMLDLVAAVGVTPTIQGYYNKGGAGWTTVSGTGPNNATDAMNMSETVLRLFSLKDANVWTQNRGSTIDTGRQQFRGSYRVVTFGPGIMGIAGNTSLRDSLCNSSGVLQARTPFATIGGASHAIDWQGGIGDQLNGGFARSTKPGFGTYRGIKGLTVS